MLISHTKSFIFVVFFFVHLIILFMITIISIAYVLHCTQQFIQLISFVCAFFVIFKIFLVESTHFIMKLFIPHSQNLFTFSLCSIQLSFVASSLSSFFIFALFAVGISFSIFNFCTVGS